MEVETLFAFRAGWLEVPILLCVVLLVQSGVSKPVIFETVLGFEDGLNIDVEIFPLCPVFAVISVEVNLALVVFRVIYFRYLDALSISLFVKENCGKRFYVVQRRVGPDTDLIRSVSIPAGIVCVIESSHVSHRDTA